MVRDDHEPQMVPLSAVGPGGELEARELHIDEFELAPRTGPQLVDLGIEVLRRRFLPCVGLSVLLWFPIRAAMPFILRMASSMSYGSGVSFEFLGALGGHWLIARFIEVLVTMSLTLISYEALTGRELGPLAALKQTLQRSVALVSFFILQFLFVAAGAGLLMILGFMCPPLMLGAFAYWVYFSWKLAVAPSALILEGLGAVEAIKRSFALTPGSFWRWCGLMVIITLLTFGLTSGMQIGDNQLLRDAFLEATGISELWFDVVLVLISSVFSGLSTAIIAVTATTFYLDTRIRREGLDLRMRLERLSQPKVAESRA